jgi:hypothetical protein
MDSVVRYMRAVIDLDRALQGQRVDLVPRVGLLDDLLLLIARLDVLPARSLERWDLARGPVGRPETLDLLSETPMARAISELSAPVSFCLIVHSTFTGSSFM